MARKPTPDNRRVAEIAATAFGGEWKVGRFQDEGERATLHVLQSSETPNKGLISFCTIGLSDYPIPGTDRRPPSGIELMGTSHWPEFADVLATAGFSVINDGWVPEPDNLFADIVSEHFLDVTTPHLFLSPPYLWLDIHPEMLTGKGVEFVMATPVTEGERRYFKEHGADALHDALEKGDPDIVDLWRESTV